MPEEVSKSDLTDELMALQYELRDTNAALKITMPITQYENLVAKRNATIRRVQTIQNQLTRLKETRRQATEDASAELSKQCSQMHLLWCATFVDSAKEILAPEIFRAIRKNAAEKRSLDTLQPLPVLSEMALSDSEKEVLSLFMVIGMRKVRQEIYEMVLEYTDLDRKAMDDALESLVKRGLLVKGKDGQSFNRCA